MGLDMYLNRVTMVKNYDFEGNPFKVTVTYQGKPLKLIEPSEIKESVGYWRKANQIHNWFVNNVQDGEDDCRAYEVSKEQLEKLLDLCQRVKATAIMVDAEIHTGTTWSQKDGEVKHMEKGKKIENAEQIDEMLPVQSGFFFGSTNYDEYYMNDIDSTIEMLTKILKHETPEGLYQYFQYRASW